MYIHAGTIRVAREDTHVCGYDIRKGWWLNVGTSLPDASVKACFRDTSDTRAVLSLLYCCWSLSVHCIPVEQSAALMECT